MHENKEGVSFGRQRALFGPVTAGEALLSVACVVTLYVVTMVVTMFACNTVSNITSNVTP